MQIRKNDTVAVLSGREKGKTGRVLKVLRASSRAVVEKVNLIKRHERPSARNQQGGIIEKEAALPLSALMLVCPKCGVKMRPRRQRGEDGAGRRLCRACGEIV